MKLGGILDSVSVKYSCKSDYCMTAWLAHTLMPNTQYVDLATSHAASVYTGNNISVSIIILL